MEPKIGRTNGPKYSLNSCEKYCVKNDFSTNSFDFSQTFSTLSEISILVKTFVFSQKYSFRQKNSILFQNFDFSQKISTFLQSFRLWKKF